MSEDLDFESVVEENKPTGGTGVERLTELINEADMLDGAMEEASAHLQQLISRYNYIKMEQIPQMMAELQVDEWKNSDGTKVKMENFVAGSLPKEEKERKEAIDYLSEPEVGGAALLKTTIEVEFSKSQHNAALALADDIRKQGYEVNLTSSIYAQTLLAFVREKRAKGQYLDLKKIGVYAGRVAKITHAGKSKPTKVSQGKIAKPVSK